MAGQENHSAEAEQDTAALAAEREALLAELAWLFGDDIAEQAALIDVADLNLQDAMVTFIGQGLGRLKQLRHDPAAQRQEVSTMSPAERLLLCMWIMEMGLLEKIRNAPYC